MMSSGSLDFARLKEHYAQLEKYGRGGCKILEIGRYRYYGEIIRARTLGQMQGARLVREWDPATGNARTWKAACATSPPNLRPARSTTGFSTSRVFI
jgi:hypothetical protein